MQEGPAGLSDRYRAQHAWVFLQDDTADALDASFNRYSIADTMPTANGFALLLRHDGGPMMPTMSLVTVSVATKCISAMRGLTTAVGRVYAASFVRQDPADPSPLHIIYEDGSEDGDDNVLWHVGEVSPSNGFITAIYTAADLRHNASKVAGPNPMGLITVEGDTGKMYAKQFCFGTAQTHGYLRGRGGRRPILAPNDSHSVDGSTIRIRRGGAIGWLRVDVDPGGEWIFSGDCQPVWASSLPFPVRGNPARCDEPGTVSYADGIACFPAIQGCTLVPERGNANTSTITISHPDEVSALTILPTPGGGFTDASGKYHKEVKLACIRHTRFGNDELVVASAIEVDDNRYALVSQYQPIVDISQISYGDFGPVEIIPGHGTWVLVRGGDKGAMVVNLY